MMHLFKISKEDKKINVVETVNLFLLLSLSGLNFFNDSDSFLFAVFFINLLLFVFKREKIDNGFFVFFLFFVLLSITQTIWFSDGSFKSTIGFFIRILTAYLVIKNCSNFLSSFLRLLFFLSLASIFFYTFFLVFPSIEDALFANKHFWDNPHTNEFKKSLIIYNIFREPLFGIDALGLFGLPRNSGPFWEPGAFGGYLTLGIAFEMILFRKFSLRVLVLLVALATTFSTAGYVAAALFFLLYFLFLETDKKKKLLVFPALLVGCFFLIVDVDFLASKITGQVEGFKEAQTYKMQLDDDTRLGSALLDINDFHRSPLVGTGPSDETRYGKTEVLFMRTNGLADLIVRIGLIGFLFICWTFVQSLKKYFTKSEILKPKTATYIFIFITFLISLSETYFNMPFFWSLFLLQYAERIPPVNTYEIIDI
jgi:hypothetical protein